MDHGKGSALLMPYMRRRKAESDGLNHNIMLKLNMFLPDVEEDKSGHGRGVCDDVHAGQAGHVNRKGNNLSLVPVLQILGIPVKKF